MTRGPVEALDLVLPSVPQVSSRVRAPLELHRAARIDQVPRSVWDRFVPADRPHLRWGFLRAAEDSGLGRSPTYLRFARVGQTVAVAVFYQIDLDLLTLAPSALQRWARPLRRLLPGFLRLRVLCCGPCLSNADSAIHCDPRLTAEQRREVVRRIHRAMTEVDGVSMHLFKELTAAEAAAFGCLQGLGYTRAPSLPAMRLDITWPDIDGYLAAMRKTFRRHVRQDLAVRGEIEFRIHRPPFDSLAGEAYQLYNNVFARAKHTFEKLTPEFFRELGRFDQARLMVARDPADGRMVGMELLLLGPTTLQDLFVGVDYRYNHSHRMMFNLVYPIIDFAGRHQVRTYALGQESYPFKARLGARPEPLSIFVRHRLGPVNWVLRRFRGVLCPREPVPEYQVFHP